MSQPEKQENPFYNLLFNIILPVAILNQLSKRLGEDGPTIALLVALAFPIIYGLLDYVKRKKKNWLSLLGIVNVAFTGGLALMQLEGIWFAVKEAAFPFLIGIAVYVSKFTSKPLMRFIAMNDALINTKLINEKLAFNQNTGSFDQLMRKSTGFFALSFFISSALNFILAIRIFTPIDASLSEIERNTILNEQIAQMTWLGFVVIALPLMFFMMGIMWHLLSGIKKLTSLEINDILVGQR